MPRATLIVDADTSALNRSLGEIPRIAQRAQAATTSAARAGGRERLTADQQFTREHEAISMRLARAKERRAKEETAKLKEEERKRVQADAEFARMHDSIHAQLLRAREQRERAATRAEAAEGRKRVAAERAFNREHDSAHARMVRARVARERQAQREVDQITRERRQAGGRAGEQGAAVLGQTVAGIHAATQAPRQTMAERESALNTSLVQRGTSQSENAADNARIMARLREVRTGVAPEVALQAIAGAQSFANALGGDTRAQRAAGIEATLRDVELAGAIDPTNVSGIVNMGAILRRRVRDPAMQQRILRGAVGTAFEGSVETDQMITSGLPGLLTAISAGTANAASPEERDRLTAEISQDFFAQLQAQAAGGRSVGVSANRTNTVRAALANTVREGRLGLALAEQARTGGPEAQAAFAAAFTKDAQTGEYTMNESVRNTPSNAARFFGAMFNNDASALRNGLGANGLGGPRQLMRDEDVAAIGSYFGMTTGSDGSQVREYDHVEQLKRASLTPEQEATMRATRGGEDRTRLMREQEAAMAASRQPGLATRASDAVASFATAHPVMTALGATVGGTITSALAKAGGAKLVGALGMGPAGIAVGSALGGLALSAYGSAAESSAVGPDGQPRTAGQRAANAGAGTLGTALFPGAALLQIQALRDAARDLATAAASLRNAPPPTITPHDAAHVVSGIRPAGGRIER